MKNNNYIATKKKSEPFKSKTDIDRIKQFLYSKHHATVFYYIFCTTVEMGIPIEKLLNLDKFNTLNPIPCKIRLSIRCKLSKDAVKSIEEYLYACKEVFNLYGSDVLYFIKLQITDTIQHATSYLGIKGYFTYKSLAQTYYYHMHLKSLKK